MDFGGGALSKGGTSVRRLERELDTLAVLLARYKRSLVAQGLDASEREALLVDCQRRFLDQVRDAVLARLRELKDE